MNPNPAFPLQLLEVGPFALLFIGSVSLLFPGDWKGGDRREAETTPGKRLAKGAFCVIVSVVSLIRILTGHPILP